MKFCAVVSVEDQTLDEKSKLWPVLVIVVKSRLNAFFEIIMKAGRTSVESMSYPCNRKRDGVTFTIAKRDFESVKFVKSKQKTSVSEFSRDICEYDFSLPSFPSSLEFFSNNVETCGGVEQTQTYA